MPEYSKIIIICLVVMFIITLLVMIKTKSVFKAFLTSALSGLGSLFAVNLLSAFTGITIAINWFSIATCMGMGVCGSIALLCLNIIDKI